MNKPVYLGLSVLELCKILIYEFQYDYVKATYGEKVKFCYMDTNNFYVYNKEQKTIWCQNQIIILQSFHKKSISNRNKKNRDTDE